MRPTPTSEFSDYLPHRAPMLWVDEVLEVDATKGVCRVRLKPDAHYMNAKQIRPSSFIEWMAQSYGFVRADQLQKKLIPQVAIPKVTFLAQVRHFKMTSDTQNIADEYFVCVEHVRDLGPLSLIRAEVKTADKTIVASAELKVFAQ